MKKVLALILTSGLLTVGAPNLAHASDSMAIGKAPVSKVKVIKTSVSKKVRKKFIVASLSDTATQTNEPNTTIPKTDTSTATSASLTMADFMKFLEMITTLSKNSSQSIVTTVSPVITVSPTVTSAATSSATATANPVVNQMMAPHGDHHSGGNND